MEYCFICDDFIIDYRICPDLCEYCEYYFLNVFLKKYYEKSTFKKTGGKGWF